MKDQNKKFGLILLSILAVMAILITNFFSFYGNQIAIQKQKEQELKQKEIEQKIIVLKQKETEKLQKKIFWNQKRYSYSSIKSIISNDEGYEIITDYENGEEKTIKLDKIGNQISISTKKISKNFQFPKIFDILRLCDDTRIDIKSKKLFRQNVLIKSLNLDKEFIVDDAICQNNHILLLAHKYTVPNKFFPYLIVYDKNFNQILQKQLALFVPENRVRGQFAKFKIAKFKNGFLLITFLERFDDETEGRFDFKEFDLNGNLLNEIKSSAYPPDTKINCTANIDNGVLIGGESYYNDISQKILNHEIITEGFSKKEAILFKIDLDIPLNKQQIKPFYGKFERKAWGE
ncbi:hypothetical protein OFO03_05495 [Campylobacter sp. JMF_02 ED1]|uniref:hypothetical protein n=1 Tax=unclassified Campylobacter TaxID=2593542 RepID=UPI0022EA06C6|nr:MULTISPECIES: hypothetical protein [unclassified Campylobacter]MDA3049229.1 hypothetical protein [Campylobacter sp. JMF_15 NE4]MDA3051346.1 hypothetical protein [Campylobacter sp. JMF_02 ED1]